MKILVCYFSGTGNTEKVAKSIQEGLEGQDIELLKVKDVDLAKIGDYDLVVLGSGIYGGSVSKNINNMMRKITKFPSKVAFFNTHSSPMSYSGKAFKRIIKKFQAGGSEVVGNFECIGENLGIPKEKQVEMWSNLPPNKQEKAKLRIEEISGRPNAEDLENAKKFGKTLI